MSESRNRNEKRSININILLIKLWLVDTVIKPSINGQYLRVPKKVSRWYSNAVTRARFVHVLDGLDQADARCHLDRAMSTDDWKFPTFE